MTGFERDPSTSPSLIGWAKSWSLTAMCFSGVSHRVPLMMGKWGFCTGASLNILVDNEVRAVIWEFFVKETRRIVWIHLNFFNVFLVEFYA